MLPFYFLCIFHFTLLPAVFSQVQNYDYKDYDPIDLNDYDLEITTTIPTTTTPPPTTRRRRIRKTKSPKQLTTLSTLTINEVPPITTKDLPPVSVYTTALPDSDTLPITPPPTKLFTDEIISLEKIKSDIPWYRCEKPERSGSSSSLDNLFITGFEHCSGECPRFEVICRTREYEVRKYPETTWAYTTATSYSYNWASRQGFLRLYKYFNRENGREVKFSTTSPVLTQIKEHQSISASITSVGKKKDYTILFYIPQAYHWYTPAPRDNKVQIRKMESQTVFTLIPDVLQTEAKIENTAERFKTLLRNYNEEFLNEYYYANFERTGSINTHNEIWVPMRYGSTPYCKKYSQEDLDDNGRSNKIDEKDTTNTQNKFIDPSLEISISKTENLNSKYEGGPTITTSNQKNQTGQIIPNTNIKATLILSGNGNKENVETDNDINISGVHSYDHESDIGTVQKIIQGGQITKTIDAGIFIKPKPKPTLMPIPKPSLKIVKIDRLGEAVQIHENDIVLEKGVKIIKTTTENQKNIETENGVKTGIESGLGIGIQKERTDLEISVNTGIGTKHGVGNNVDSRTGISSGVGTGIEKEIGSGTGLGIINRPESEKRTDIGREIDIRTGSGTGVGIGVGIGNRPGSRPGIGTHSIPGSETDSRPESEINRRPGSETGSIPGSGTGIRPGSGTGIRPGSGTGIRPGSGTDSIPGSSTGSGPGSGTDSRPGSGNDSRPGSETDKRPGSGIGSSPESGTGNGVGIGKDKGISAESETGNIIRSGSGIELKPESEAKTGFKTGHGIGIKTGSVSGTDKEIPTNSPEELASLLLKLNICSGDKCPTLSLLEFHRFGIQKRTYQNTYFLIASPDVCGYEESIKKGTEMLNAYINGNNSRKEKVDLIALTVSLLKVSASSSGQEGCEKKYDVVYYLPEHLQVNPPWPLDPKITLRGIKELAVYSNSILGPITERTTEREQMVLEKKLKSLNKCANPNEYFVTTYITAGSDAVKNELWMLADETCKTASLKEKKTADTLRTYSACSARGVECPWFDQIEIHKSYEGRGYSPAKYWLATDVKACHIDDARNLGFMRLFQYVMGENEHRSRLVITAPTILTMRPARANTSGEQCEETFTMSYYLQSNTPPKPLNPRVYLKRIMGDVFVKVFNYTNDDSIRVALNELVEELKQDGRCYDDDEIVLSEYDQPWVSRFHTELWMFRRWCNEAEEFEAKRTEYFAVEVDDLEYFDLDYATASKFNITYEIQTDIKEPTSTPETCKKTKCASYEMIKRYSRFEERKYTKDKWICSRYFGCDIDSVSKRSHTEIFNYFYGDDNVKNELLKNTAPMVTKMEMSEIESEDPSCHHDYETCSFIPLENQNNIPEPMSKSELRIQPLESENFYVLSYGGYTHSERIKELVGQFKKMLDDNKLYYKDVAYSAIYDDSRRVWKRHNEIWIPRSETPMPKPTMVNTSVLQKIVTRRRKRSTTPQTLPVELPEYF